MSQWNTRQDWPRQARDCIAALNTRNIPLPETVTAALAVLDRVERAKPFAPEHTAIRKAILDGATTDQINALVLADLGAQKIAVEHGQARIDAAGAVLAAVLAAADKIMPALRKLAEAAISRLADVAALDGARLDDLVRAGRTDDAQAVANVATVASELDSHYEVRDRYLTRGGPQALTVAGWNGSRWRDPVMASYHVSGGNPADRYLKGLAAGVPLWFPTKSEAVAVAQAVADGQAAEAGRIKAEQFGVGSVSGW